MKEIKISKFLGFFIVVMRVTPSLPQRGKQPKGSIPFNTLEISLGFPERVSYQIVSMRGFPTSGPLRGTAGQGGVS